MVIFEKRINGKSVLKAKNDAGQELDVLYKAKDGSTVTIEDFSARTPGFVCAPAGTVAVKADELVPFGMFVQDGEELIQIVPTGGVEWLISSFSEENAEFDQEETDEEEPDPED